MAGRMKNRRPRLAPSRGGRTPFQRDRDRILHSAAFRKLKHKTQVFVYHEGDYFRTRMTHSIEVAQIARSMARALKLNDDLAEAVALAHDLGHTPFGHAGEEALGRSMQEFGGFDHNEQTLRVLTSLEHRYADFDGLNLTWETLEGVVKHNGPLEGPDPVRPAVAALDAAIDLELAHFRLPRRSSPTWPTTSPICRMISTMRCAPGCSASTRLSTCRRSGPS